MNISELIVTVLSVIITTIVAYTASDCVEHAANFGMAALVAQVLVLLVAVRLESGNSVLAGMPKIVLLLMVTTPYAALVV